VGVEAAQARYELISDQTRRLSDFRSADLERSRRFFDLSAPGLRTHPFDVITCVVGLPLPGELQHALLEKRDEVLGLIPAAARVYRVAPACLHWEAHIIKRADEPDPAVPFEDLERAVRLAVGETPAFSIDFGGFFVSPEGTVCFQGLGDWVVLRRRLGERLACSSAHQLDTGHVSVARILDPIGASAFAQLVALRDASSSDRYGTLQVEEVKLVLERRWYMEDHTVVGVARTRAFGSR
jgi:hypothetical protein